MELWVFITCYKFVLVYSLYKLGFIYRFKIGLFLFLIFSVDNFDVVVVLKWLKFNSSINSWLFLLSTVHLVVRLVGLYLHNRISGSFYFFFFFFKLTFSKPYKYLSLELNQKSIIYFCVGHAFLKGVLIRYSFE